MKVAVALPISMSTEMVMEIQLLRNKFPVVRVFPGYVGQGGDCNDYDPSIHPGAAEICGNGIDDNCDGQVDEGCGCFAYLDADGDGYGNPATATPVSCGEGIPGYVGQGGDCNDDDPSVHPNAAEYAATVMMTTATGKLTKNALCTLIISMPMVTAMEEIGYPYPIHSTSGFIQSVAIVLTMKVPYTRCYGDL
jgi:hypothetical protein